MTPLDWIVAGVAALTLAGHAIDRLYWRAWQHGCQHGIEVGYAMRRGPHHQREEP